MPTAKRPTGQMADGTKGRQGQKADKTNGFVFPLSQVSYAKFSFSERIHENLYKIYNLLKNKLNFTSKL